MPLILNHHRKSGNGGDLLGYGLQVCRPKVRVHEEEEVALTLDCAVGSHGYGYDPWGFQAYCFM